MNKRIVKQLLYGSGFIIFLIVVIFGLYFLLFRSAPTCFDKKQNGNEEGIDCGGGCSPCAIKYAKTIGVSEIEKISVGPNKVAFLAKIFNSNDGVGAEDFIYSFDITNNSGEIIKSVSDHSFIYPSENKYLLEIVDLALQDVSNVKLNFSEVKWTPKDEFERPNVSIREWEPKISNIKPVNFQDYTFTKDLSLGIKSDDVKELEVFLKNEGYFKNTPDQTFDLYTKSILSKYQKDKKLSEKTGYFGAATRDYVNKKLRDRKDAYEATLDGSKPPLVIEGILKNNDISKVTKTIIIASAYNNLGAKVGVAKTEIGQMDPTQEKNFSIYFSKDIDLSNISTSSIKVELPYSIR